MGGQPSVALLPSARLQIVVASQCGTRRPTHLYAAGQTRRLEPIGERHIVGEYVELPLASAQYAAVHAARVNADAHVQLVDASHEAHQGDRFDHVDAHFDARVRVLGIRFGQAGDAIVAVAEEFYAKALIVRRQLVEACK